jgi:hypothetical protein
MQRAADTGHCYVHIAARGYRYPTTCLEPPRSPSDFSFCDIECPLVTAVTSAGLCGLAFYCIPYTYTRVCTCYWQPFCVIFSKNQKVQLGSDFPREILAGHSTYLGWPELGNERTSGLAELRGRRNGLRYKVVSPGQQECSNPFSTSVHASRGDGLAREIPNPLAIEHTSRIEERMQHNWIPERHTMTAL